MPRAQAIEIDRLACGKAVFVLVVFDCSLVSKKSLGRAFVVGQAIPRPAVNRVEDSIRW